MSRIAIIFLILFLTGIMFAGTGYSGNSKIEKALCEVYCLVNGLLPIIAFVLFVLAGVAYAAGQFFGAEMRAKAIGWAMNMITGAILGLVLSAVGPSILNALSPTSVSLDITCACS